MKKTFYFATSNKGKYREAKEKFSEAGLKLKRKPVDLLEIQDDSIEKISLISARELAKTFKKPFFVEDAGLFVNALGGFPGPYSKYAYYHLWPQGILKLMAGVKNRSAYYISAIVFLDPIAAPKPRNSAAPCRSKLFKGICKGSLTHSVQGTKGFGFDPIFIPEGERKTFASDFSLKKRVSHRALALNKLIAYLKREYS